MSVAKHDRVNESVTLRAEHGRPALLLIHGNHAELGAKLREVNAVLAQFGIHVCVHDATREKMLEYDANQAAIARCAASKSAKIAPDEMKLTPEQEAQIAARREYDGF